MRQVGKQHLNGTNKRNNSKSFKPERAMRFNKQISFFSGVLVLYCCCIVSLFIFFQFSIVVMFFSRFDFYFSKANIESFFHCYSEVSGLCVSFILTHSLCFHPVSFLYLCFIVIFVMWMHQFEQFLHRCVCVCRSTHCLSTRQALKPWNITSISIENPHRLRRRITDLFSFYLFLACWCGCLSLVRFLLLH